MKLGRPPKKPYNPIEDMHLAGLTVDMIAHLSGYARDYCYEYLHKRGHKATTGRRSGAPKGRYGCWCVEEMYLAGLMPEEIAKLLGHPLGVIRRDLYAAGYKPAIEHGFRYGDHLRSRMDAEARQAIAAKKRRVIAWHAAGRPGGFSESYYVFLSRKIREP